MTGHGRNILERHAFLVAPEIIRIIAVRMTLAVVAIEPVEPLLNGITVRMRSAEAPFAKRPGHVTLRL